MEGFFLLLLLHRAVDMVIQHQAIHFLCINYSLCCQKKEAVKETTRSRFAAFRIFFYYCAAVTQCYRISMAFISAAYYPCLAVIRAYQKLCMVRFIMCL